MNQPKYTPYQKERARRLASIAKALNRGTQDVMVELSILKAEAENLNVDVEMFNKFNNL